MNVPAVKSHSSGDSCADAAALRCPHPDDRPYSHTHALVVAFAEAAREAGALAQDYFRQGEQTSAGMHRKEDGSPVTDADLAVNQFLEQRLRVLLPDAAWLSEESTDLPGRLDKDFVLVVDPIDGTRAFAAGNRVWAVSIALVHRHRPVIGVVHAPALAETYVAVESGGATCNGEPISVSARRSLDGDARVGGPVGFAQRLRGAGLVFDLQPRIPSLAMRISRVAAGVLDAGLISANAHDWDIAAADLILSEAGGRLVDLRGRCPHYNRVHTLHGELLAGAPPLLHEIQVAAGLGRSIAL